MAPFAHGVSCPDCIAMAGCQKIGCPCFYGGVTYRPPSNPQNVLIPGCPACAVQKCPVSYIPCLKIADCTAANAGYVVSEVQIPTAS